MLERADARLLLALLVLRRVVAAVLLEVALLASGFDALRDLLPAGGREVLELGGEAVVGILSEEGHGGIAGHVLLLRCGATVDMSNAPALGQGAYRLQSAQTTSPSRS
nr:hypothetical protein GCM10025699_33400 [Microbacterium flavescens]